MQIIVCAGKRLINFDSKSKPKRRIASMVQAPRVKGPAVLAFLAWDKPGKSVRISADTALQRIARAAAETQSKQVFLGALPPLSGRTVDAARTRRLMKTVTARLKASRDYRVSLLNLEDEDAVALEVDRDLT